MPVAIFRYGFSVSGEDKVISALSLSLVSQMHIGKCLKCFISYSHLPGIQG
jgi:hypothetical protein